MDSLFWGILVAIVVGGVIYCAHEGARMTEQTFGAFFRGHTPDPWPRGVQEEYLDSWDASNAAQRPEVPKAAVTEELTALQNRSAVPIKRLARRGIRTRFVGSGTGDPH